MIWNLYSWGNILFFKAFLSLYVLSFSIGAFALGGSGPIDIAKNLKGARNEKPPFLDEIGIDEHLGDQVDLSLPFVDDRGEKVTLGKYFTGEKPVFLMLIYYDCPTLCNTHLNTLITTLKNFEWKIGEKFDFVTISIDPKEGPKLAAEKKKSYLDMYGMPETKDNWHFLTGNEKSIKAITSQIGFRYAWNYNDKEWAHAAASYVLTPEGKISYYHYGLMLQPKVFRLSLVEATNNKIGSVMDKLVLMCLQYDPTKKTYAFYAYNIMRVGAALMILIFGIFFFRFWRESRKEAQV